MGGKGDRERERNGVAWITFSLCVVVRFGRAGDGERFWIFFFIDEKGVRLNVPVDADFKFEDTDLSISFFKVSELGDPAA